MKAIFVPDDSPALKDDRNTLVGEMIRFFHDAIVLNSGEVVMEAGSFYAREFDFGAVLSAMLTGKGLEARVSKGAHCIGYRQEGTSSGQQCELVDNRGSRLSKPFVVERRWLYDGEDPEYGPVLKPVL